MPRQKGQAVPEYHPTLASVDIDEVPDITREGKAIRILEEFLASGAKAARVDEGAKTFGASLKRQVTKRSLPVEVLTRQGVTYLRLAEGEAETEGFSEPEMSE